MEAPNEADERLPGPSLFLAGGISGCPDWQLRAVRRLDAAGCRAKIFNPRRTAFSVEDPAAAPEQIAWEHRHLARADVILFWFPASDSMQPIALYELGAHAARGKPLAVGTDPAYGRRLDVVEQLALERPEVLVHDSLRETVRTAMRLLDAVGA
ncbi:nucleoside 2-deoxyribosyltransferase domain-containing protein [Streptomyces sp. NPDC052236]|uniref:nucleoside 2-deoxyribosyltransferase domain-containing protein n=1 Tax=Streptomyces sp. NPDC052236 TaxID=3365686 RepID=UPI0037CF48B5